VRCQGARRRSKRAVSDCFYNSRVRVKWGESDKAVAGLARQKTRHLVTVERIIVWALESNQGNRSSPYQDNSKCEKKKVIWNRKPYSFRVYAQAQLSKTLPPCLELPTHGRQQRVQLTAGHIISTSTISSPT
jgi:hypothetical protein